MSELPVVRAAPLDDPGLDVIAVANLLAAMIWIGGIFAVGTATLTARATLPPLQQVEFFRGLGRRYGLLSGSALVTFAGTGLALIGGPGSWNPEEAALVGLTILVAALTAVGVAAARIAQRLALETLLGAPDVDVSRRRDSWQRRAAGLRILIAAASLLTVAVAGL